MEDPVERRTAPIAALAAAAALVLAACSSQGAPAADSAASSVSSPAATAAPQTAGTDQTGSTDKAAAESATAAKAAPGAYIDYADYSANQERYADSDVVLFFNATWCPSCQEADGNLESASIPDGLTVVSVDYDTSDELKQRYGVTTQHTFVQVGAGGEQLAKFTGSTTVAQIQDELA
jgi:thiol-disulfide isomerase/thioredoxin